MIRALTVLTAVMGITLGGNTSIPPASDLVAILDLSQLPAGTKDASAQSITFVSDSSIAIGLCPAPPAKGCSLSLLRREGSELRLSASTSHFLPGMFLHVASEGRILAGPIAGSPALALLFSADLSSAQEIPNVHASQSGNIVAEFVRGGWKLYQVKSRLQLIREGKGSLRSVSDEAVVFQDGNAMRIETLEGARLGSFPVKPTTRCYNVAYLVGKNRLYLDDCKKIRTVDFNGIKQATLHPPNGWRAHQSWSRDGTRILFGNFGRKISFLRNAGEIFVAVASLGTGVEDEQENREEVVVLDTVTSNLCFDWKRNFSEGTALEQHVAISPSGEFVAIAAGGKLSVVHLPDVCAKRK